ncbi:hypothetical protein D3C81_1827980 [compost metagenome]
MLVIRSWKGGYQGALFLRVWFNITGVFRLGSKEMRRRSFSKEPKRPVGTSTLTRMRLSPFHRTQLGSRPGPIE